VDFAKGVWIQDVYGKRYIDWISGISVSNVGHVHPEVLAAIHTQSAAYMHVMVYGEYVLSPQVQLAQRIAGILPTSLNSVYFVNSGAEAAEGAVKLAKRATGRSKVISCINAYHGSTHGALSLMGNEFFKRAYRPLLPDVYHIPFGKFDAFNEIDKSTACVVIEPIQGEAGIILPPAGYLKALREHCTKLGVILIFDEIQSGFGRTGACFAFRHEKVVPDILLMAKGMGGGMPIGAFVASKELMSLFTHNPVLGHITTFGGHPVSCAASLACLNVILRDNLEIAATKAETIIRHSLIHPLIQEIRGKGLLLAAQFASNDIALKVMQECFSQGLITDWFLFADDCLRIAPPLTISNEEIEDGCERFKLACDIVASRI
jgi:acetylornithine/succinyldiaminopimelate/putrescine aminotransferase